MKQIYSFALAALCLCFVTGCRKDDFNQPTPSTQEVVENNPAESARCSKVPADVANDWMQAYRKIVNSEGKNPPQASRIYAYAAVALYEAVVPGTRYRSLEGQVAGLTNLPNSCHLGNLDYKLAANEALYQVAKTIFVTLKVGNSSYIDSLHNVYVNNPGTSLSNTVITNSISFGNQVAVAVLNRASNDNFTSTRSLTYIVPSQSVNLAYWVPTGPVTNPMEPYWGTLKPFAMANGSACTIKSTVPFSTVPGSPFYNQALEIANTETDLTQTQKDIALWWADGTSATPTPPGHWAIVWTHLLSHSEGVPCL